MERAELRSGPPGRAPSGFTIIEALVALFILTMVTAGVFSVLLISMRQSHESRERIVANILAESTLDEILAHPPGELKDLAGWKKTKDGLERKVTFPVVRDGLEFSTEYDLKIHSEAAGVKIEVSWAEKDKRKHLLIPVKLERLAASSRGSRPERVEETWHNPPSERQFSTEPEFRRGDAVHDIPQPPEPGGDDQTDKLVSCLQQKSHDIAPIYENIRDLEKQLKDLNKHLDEAKDEDKEDIQSQVDATQSSLDSENERASELQSQIKDINERLEKGQTDSFECPPSP